MDQSQFIKHVMDIFTTGYTTACDTLPIFQNSEAKTNRKREELHEKPDEPAYGYRSNKNRR